jgi:hypothetical protein
MEKIPENLREAAYKHMTEYINHIVTNDKAASMIAYNQDSFDATTHSPVVITMASEDTLDISRSRLKELIEAEEEIEMRAGISLFNDHPTVMLKNSAEFLVNDPNIDDLAERFEAGLEAYLSSKLQGAQNITESKRRVKIRVRR